MLKDNHITVLVSDPLQVTVCLILVELTLSMLMSLLKSQDLTNFEDSVPESWWVILLVKARLKVGSRSNFNFENDYIKFDLYRDITMIHVTLTRLITWFTKPLWPLFKFRGWTSRFISLLPQATSASFAMQAQSTRTEVQAITHSQSLVAVQTLLRAGLGCITFLRCAIKLCGADWNSRTLPFPRDLLPADNFNECWSEDARLVDQRSYMLSQVISRRLKIQLLLNPLIPILFLRKNGRNEMSTVSR